MTNPGDPTIKSTGENRKALGRGLAALLANSATLDSQEPPKQAILPSQISKMESSLKSPFRMLKISEVRPNPAQPRKTFNQAKIDELANSMREHGVIQPILVRRLALGGYEIIAGERRWRAAQAASLSEIPVIVREENTEDLSDDLVSIIENIQREDLNPLELSQAYERLLLTHSLTQEALADKLGVSRVSIANTLRLLRLPESVKELLRNKVLSEGHARALLPLEDEVKISALAQRAVAEKWTVREVEQQVREAQISRSVSSGGAAGGLQGQTSKSPELSLIEDELRRVFGTKVALRGNLTRGSLEIYFSGKDSLHRILHLIRSMPQ
jgi:ParB family chromosome partitioning protein